MSTNVLAVMISIRAFVNVVASESVRVEQESLPTSTLVSSLQVLAQFVAACMFGRADANVRRLGHFADVARVLHAATFINVRASVLVLLQPISLVALALIAALHVGAFVFALVEPVAAAVERGSIGRVRVAATLVNVFALVFVLHQGPSLPATTGVTAHLVRTLAHVVALLLHVATLSCKRP